MTQNVTCSNTTLRALYAKQRQLGGPSRQSRWRAAQTVAAAPQRPWPAHAAPPLAPATDAALIPSPTAFAMYRRGAGGKHPAAPSQASTPSAL